MPRAALWCTLQKYGVPDVLMELVWPLHDGMSATVMVEGGRSEPFFVGSGGIRDVLLLLLCLFCTMG